MDKSLANLKTETASNNLLLIKKSTSKLFFLSIALNLILIIILGLGCYFFKVATLSNDIDLWSAQNKQSTQSGDLGWQNLLYSATIYGKILNIAGNKITVKNNQGAIGELQLNPNVEISGQDSQSKKTTRTKGLQDLKLDQAATLILKPVNGKYEVTSIGYLITVEKKLNATNSAKNKQ